MKKKKYGTIEGVYAHFKSFHKIHDPVEAGIIPKRIIPTQISNATSKSFSEKERVGEKRRVDASCKLPPTKRHQTELLGFDKVHHSGHHRNETSNPVKILGDGIKIKTMVMIMRSVPEKQRIHQFSVSNIEDRFIKCNLCLSSFKSPPQISQHIRDVHKIAIVEGNSQVNIDPTLTQKEGAVETLKRICQCSLFDVVSLSWSGLESHLQMIHKILLNNNTLNMLLQLKVNDVRTSITNDPSFVPALERCEILFADGYFGFDSLALDPQIHDEHVFSYDFHPDDNYLNFLRRFLF